MSAREWWQFYDGWGPGEYYGQKVLVHYTAVNKWTLEKTEINGFSDITNSNSKWRC